MDGDSVLCVLEYVQNVNYRGSSEVITVLRDYMLPAMLCPAEKLLSSLRYPGAVICCEV